MKSRNDRAAEGSPKRNRRFRLERLEERIAPRLHQNPQTKWVGGGGGGNGTVNSNDCTLNCGG